MPICLISQDSYFQQDVKYVLDAKYTDSTRMIESSLDFYYKNNSDQYLDTIYFHLWINAFSTKQSDFSKQMLRLQNRSFYFSSIDERGNYKSITIKTQEENLEIIGTDSQDEIIGVVLNQTLAPNSEITLNIDYKAVMPKLFSRLGVGDKNVQLMHWYPRVCVYDKKGWHKMPYLAFGEFYGEISDFDIKFTCNKDYEIDATGQAKLLSYNSLDSTSLYRLNAENVVDFALVLSNQNDKFQSKPVKSIDGHEVLLTVRYNDNNEIWQNALSYLEESFRYMESNVGPYPYDQLRIIETEEHTCNGMEYPCIMTVSCSEDFQDLEYYIIHEVAHQWFYNILASNERDEPWLDEGFATFYEKRYTTDKYGEDHYTSKLPNHQSDYVVVTAQHYALIQQIKRRKYQSVTSNPTKLAAINYGLGAYVRPALAYQYLERYLGQNEFDQIMKSFISIWSHKHPSTEDFHRHFEEACGKDLTWLWQDWVSSDKKMDYAVKEVSNTEIVLENNGEIVAPIQIDHGENTYWIDGFSGEHIIARAEPNNSLTIDPLLKSIDFRAENNSTLPRKIKPLLGFRGHNPRYRELFLMPTIGYNANDGFLLGLGAFNSGLGVKNLKFVVAPFFGFNTKEIVGEGWISYNQYRKGNNTAGKRLEYKLGVKSFHFNQLTNFDIANRYIKIEPSINYHFNSDHNHQQNKKIGYRYIHLLEELATFQNEIISQEYLTSGLHELNYEMKDNGPNQRSAFVSLEYMRYNTFAERSESFLKLNLETTKAWYFQRDKQISFRLYGAYFITNSRRESSNYNDIFTKGSISLFSQGFNDYKYDDYSLNRTRQTGPFRNQILNGGGGFKTALGSQFRVGQSNDYAISTNITVDLPFKLPRLLRPLEIFADAAYISTKSVTSQPLEGEFLYSAGLSYTVKIDQEVALGIYYPIVNSQNISDIYDQNQVSRMSFTLNLKPFNLWNASDNINL